jgi:hypothetical protein
MLITRRTLVRAIVPLASGVLPSLAVFLTGGCGESVNVGDVNDPEVKKSLSNKYSGFANPASKNPKKRGRR